MYNVALIPQGVMASTDKYIYIYKYRYKTSFLKMQPFTKHDGAMRGASTYKSVSIGCQALLCYKKLLLMRCIYARKYKKLIFSIQAYFSNEKETHPLQH